MTHAADMARRRIEAYNDSLPLRRAALRRRRWQRRLSFILSLGFYGGWR